MGKAKGRNQTQEFTFCSILGTAVEKDVLRSGLALAARLFWRIHTQNETNPRANLDPGRNSLSLCSGWPSVKAIPGKALERDIVVLGKRGGT